MKSILNERSHWYFLLSGTFALLFLAVPFLANAVITTSLDIGATGTEVTEVQTFLAAQPTLYPEGLVTGYYGTLTAAAVQRYQCQKGIVCSGSAAATGYGRVGPQTRAAINFDLGAAPGTGGSANDVFAPIMTGTTVTLSATSSAPASATISWGTNEAARSRVMYSTTWPFLYAAAPSVADATVDTSTSITLTNLAPSTTYFYVQESVDASGNVMWSASSIFRTNP